MQLFFDECVGKGVPEALRQVGYQNIHYAGDVYRHRLQTHGNRVQDWEWIPTAGRRGWLVVTEDLAILNDPQERGLLVEHSVGIVFLKAATRRRREVLLFMLRRMSWLEQIDAQARPFAYVTTLGGSPRSVVW